ncbi:uncharacterized protein VTP21DRAFT_11741 [Calcarisporiella thermophila]|uniref:uncharacterized protein n=1 Tax=Calcarisporiella thermophila TaxID=911321 RepID=UPI003744592C
MHTTFLFTLLILATMCKSRPIAQREAPSILNVGKTQEGLEKVLQPMCFEINSYLDPESRKSWPCEPLTFENAAITEREFTRRQQKDNATDISNQIQVQFKCNEVPDKQCNKAKKEFELAGQILSASIKFSQPILIDAQYLSFSKADPTKNGFLGFAGPTRAHPVKDDDGVVRLYPQALVKERNLNGTDFSQSDITAYFNADIPLSFIDEDQTKPQNKTAFLEVVVHELVHGLGFGSSWNNNIAPGQKFLTPQIIFTKSPNQSISVSGFMESIFDRFLVTLPENERLTEITKQLNQFNDGNPVTVQNEAEFQTMFFKSPQAAIAEKMMNKATGGQSGQGIAFVPSQDTGVNQVLLETSLNPYTFGSSISHVDKKTHLNTHDSLMKHNADLGKSFEQTIREFGNPVGPELTSILKTMGYKVEPASKEEVLLLIEKARQFSANIPSDGPNPSVNDDASPDATESSDTSPSVSERGGGNPNASESSVAIPSIRPKVSTDPRVTEFAGESTSVRAIASASTSVKPTTILSPSVSSIRASTRVNSIASTSVGAIGDAKPSVGPVANAKSRVRPIIDTSPSARSIIGASTSVRSIASPSVGAIGGVKPSTRPVASARPSVSPIKGASPNVRAVGGTKPDVKPEADTRPGVSPIKVANSNVRAIGGTKPNVRPVVGAVPHVRPNTGVNPNVGPIPEV